MADRTPLMAANWKMHKTAADATAFLDELLPEIEDVEGVDVVICPPLTALPAVVEALSGRGTRAAAQNMHEEAEGAYTGEVSAAMLTDVGAQAVILGHSERRQYFGETDEALARKIPAALAAGLLPILCVGELESEREGGETEAVLERQIGAALATIEAGALADIVVAYEPIWAIGTGRTAGPEQAQEAIAHIRSLLSRIGAGGADAVRILYGGSVKPANAVELMAQTDIDGALVGGASLEPGDFAAIVRAGA